jgi:molybdopterin/thiamine biosynthesis adenylyltransferase
MKTRHPMFDRNMDFYTEEELEKIQNTKVLVAGVGGMGGVCVELLVRLGYEKITIADFDHFEISNSNRQIHCSNKVLGKNKGQVLKDVFESINPNVQIKLLPEGVTDENLIPLVQEHDVIVNGIDNPAFSVLLRRQAFLQKTPMVDAWLTPTVTSFCILPTDTIDPETFMGYPTKDLKRSSDFTKEICQQCLHIDIAYTYKMMKSDDILPQKIMEDIANYKYQRHFPVMVWMCGCLMASEVFKITTGRGIPSSLGGVYLNYLDYHFVKIK